LLASENKEVIVRWISFVAEKEVLEPKSISPMLETKALKLKLAGIGNFHNDLVDLGSALEAATTDRRWRF
jgi:hypothetical protein